MTGEATPTNRDVSFWGDGSTHWYLDPPLDGHMHVVICDRSRLMRYTHIEGEPQDLAGIPTVVPTLVEVFPANADGSLDGTSMAALREPFMATPVEDGIDIDQILAELGYAIYPEESNGETGS